MRSVPGHEQEVPVLVVAVADRGVLGHLLELLLPGHPEHPEPAREGLPTRIGFDQGRWWATE